MAPHNSSILLTGLLLLIGEFKGKIKQYDEIYANGPLEPGTGDCPDCCDAVKGWKDAGSITVGKRWPGLLPSKNRK